MEIIVFLSIVIIIANTKNRMIARCDSFRFPFYLFDIADENETFSVKVFSGRSERESPVMSVKKFYS